MLISQVIMLKWLSGNPNHVFGNHLHGFFFKEILGSHDPNLASMLHDPNAYKPFSISHLFNHDNIYWFRITSWNNETIAQAVFAYFCHHSKIRLHSCEFELIKTTTDPQETCWSNKQTWENIIQTSIDRPFEKFRLDHFSYTSFKSGNAHIPLPVPDLIIKSLVNKLPDTIKQHMDHMDICDNDLLEYIRLKGHTIHSKYHKETYGAIASFMGITRWQIEHKAPGPHKFLLNILFHFAFYAGIGVKTTQGMGMCRIT